MLITDVYEIVSENLIGFKTQYGSTLYINFDNISFFTMDRVYPSKHNYLVIGAFGNKGFKMSYDVFEKIQEKINLDKLLKVPDGTIEKEFLRLELNDEIR